MNADLHTPVIKQYLEIKARHPNNFVFFRMGDFYELFFEDAVKASEILNLTLTTRGRSGGQDVVLAGGPVNSATRYIKTLLNLGKSIAICEQIEDSKPGKGLVKREVVRILTDGTIYDEELMDDKNQKYIGAIDVDGGIVWCEVATGKLYADQADLKEDKNFSQNMLDVIFCRFDVVEILFNEDIDRGDLVERFGFKKNSAEIPIQISRSIERLVPYPPWEFDSIKAKNILKNRLKVNSLSHLGIEKKPSILRALNALITYIEKNIGQPFNHIKSPYVYSPKKHFYVDSVSQRALELVRPHFFENKNVTLLNNLDTCATVNGSKTLKEWILSPLTSEPEITERQESVEWLTSKLLVKENFKGIGDLGHTATRITLEKVNHRQLFILTETIEKILTAGIFLENSNRRYIEDAVELFKCDELQLIKKKIRSVISRSNSDTSKETFFIKPGYNAQLDFFRNQRTLLEEELTDLEFNEREKTNISSLKVGHSTVHGYYIEVGSSSKNKVPERYRRKQTLKNGERYNFDELIAIDKKITEVDSEIEKLEKIIFAGLCSELKSSGQLLFKVSEHLGTIDALLALAQKIVNYKWVIPKITNVSEIKIKNGWHPVLKEINEQSKSLATVLKNDTTLESDNNMMLVTGPNMSGKSTYMRQVAVIIVLAKMGSPVPAESATIGSVKSIFTRIGTADDIGGGRSTFMVEMTEAAKLLNFANKDSLVLIDEIGRGTSTKDGLALAWAIAEHLATKNKALSIFSTHYFELTELPDRINCINNFHFETVEQKDKIIFLYSLKKGAASSSFGLKVAKLAGISKDIIESATKIQELDFTHLNIKADPQYKIDEPNQRESSSFKEIMDVDLDTLTPLQALNLLHEIKENYGSQK